MAFTAFHNINGANGVDSELIAPGLNVKIKSILLCNIDDADVTASLFFQDNPTSGSTSSFYIIHTLVIPQNSSLLIEESDGLIFDNDTYGLYITVGSSDTLDVMINI